METYHNCIISIVPPVLAKFAEWNSLCIIPWPAVIHCTSPRIQPSEGLWQLLCTNFKLVRSTWPDDPFVSNGITMLDLARQSHSDRFHSTMRVITDTSAARRWAVVLRGSVVEHQKRADLFCKRKICENGIYMEAIANPVGCCARQNPLNLFNRCHCECGW